MHVEGIILARMGSTRLPGKALADLAGRPLLEHVLARASRIPGLAGLSLATSDTAEDDPLAAWAEGLGLPVFRGDALDVAGRTLACAQQCRAEYFLRLNGDSPCLDPELAGQGLALCAKTRPDFVTNLLTRGHPYGVAVEIVRVQTYAALYPRFDAPGHREHVTAYLYDHASALTVGRLAPGDPSRCEVRLVVDTAEDLERLRHLAASLGQDFPTADTDRLVRAWRRLFQPRSPELSA